MICDITNVLRYSDICLLGSSDPFPIEIKSSKTKDSRGKRQKKKLKSLSSFLTLNRSNNFRGRPGTTFRTEFSTPPKSYSDQLHAAIDQAEISGSSTFEVDGCLKVLVITGDSPDFDVLFDGFAPSRVLVNSINQIKTNMMWGCYYPYPLNLSEPAHYEKFVRGDLHIITLVDLGAFEEKLAIEGTSLSVEADENYIQCQIHMTNLFSGDEEAVFLIGEHMMCRMRTDFLRPSWIVQNAASLLAKNAGEIVAATDAPKDI